ncbi:MAG TPA: hypothetical protein DDY71_11110 [Spirochaetia bacterium]|nr:hypothetical protein [Spirochaetia bacterium]
MKQYKFWKHGSVECGKGWHPLIEELFEKIDELINNNPELHDFQLLQIKEKFGKLTIYENYCDDRVEQLLNEYCNKSLEICEHCGDNGKLVVKYGWYQTLCEKCFDEK